MTDTIITWCGEPVGEMSRDQLLSVIGQMSDMMEDQRRRAEHKNEQLLERLRNRAAVRDTRQSFLGVVASNLFGGGRK